MSRRSKERPAERAGSRQTSRLLHVVATLLLAHGALVPDNGSSNQASSNTNNTGNTGNTGPSQAGRARSSRTAPRQAPKNPELDGFYTKARAIIRENQDLKLSLPDARRRVRELLGDLRAWSKKSGEKLIVRSHEYNHRDVKDAEPANTDECPLFYAEELDELCPLDEMQSEVWGGAVVFCRFECSR